MRVKQGHRVIELRPQGHSSGNRLVLAGCEMHELDGRYIGFWHARTMPRELKHEALAELARHWMPATYNAEALR